MKFDKKIIYLALFTILYLAVASVSTLHAISFFGLANAHPLAILLAVTFEIGQAAVLFSILTSKKDRSKIMPWCLMGILTLVQILGNVFSSYKYLITNSSENLRYFKEPIFVWMDLPDQQCNVILTYIIGAIMPIIALCLTSMVTSYLNDEDEQKQLSSVDETIKQETSENKTQVINEDLPKVNISELPRLNNDENESNTKELSEDDIRSTEEKEKSNNIEEQTTSLNNKEERQSHFINL